MSPKHTNTLSLKTKVEVIKAQEENNLTVKQLVKKYKCGKTQIYNIIKNKERIKNEWLEGKRQGDSKRNLRQTGNEDINRILYEWYLDARTRDLHVSGPILQSQAKIIAKRLGKENFKASNGWLESFRIRHGISFKQAKTYFKIMAISGITVTIENKIQIIKFNNPQKKNAIQIIGYKIIKEALENGAKNPDVALTVLTGTEDYYSSGFDMTDSDMYSNIIDPLDLLKQMIDAIIDYPKLLISVVNGPAIGLAVTTLGLCDIVYASERASFITPFSKLGLCAEGCASYTFPRILGKSKANEMLLVGHKMSAEEAYQFGLVSKVYKHSEMNELWKRINEFKDVSSNSILISKEMSKKFDVNELHEVNQMEIENVRKCLASEEFMINLTKFMTRKSKM